MKAFSALLGILGLALAVYLNFSPALSLANVGQEQIARINQDLAFDLSYCETGVIGQTEAACKTEARADHARRINEIRNLASTFITGIIFVISSVSLVFLFYGIFGKTRKKNMPRFTYFTYLQPAPPATVESKLAELNTLKQSGAITEDEYKAMRQNLLNTF